MTPTEEEAKTKWCPFALVGTSIHTPRQGRESKIVGASGNRGTTMRQPLEDTYCIASACMAWRWADDKDDYEVVTTKNEVDGIVIRCVPPPSGRWRRGRCDPSHTEWRRKIRNRGYCGLAGAPHAGKP